MATCLRWIVVFGLSASVTLAQAQLRPAETQPVGASTSQPDTYPLRVTADDVLLRNQADQNSTPVARVQRDAVLDGLGREFGWERILPPEGVFSFVSAEYVDQISPEEGIVSVRSGQLRVRVGSLVTQVDPSRSEVQTLVPRGTRVRILGRDGDWLRVVPPLGVCLYVSSSLVQRVDPEVAARLRAQAVAEGRALRRVEPLRAETQPAAPDLSGAWGQRLVLVETAIDAEQRKTPLEQSWTPMIARLRPIAQQREEPMVAQLAQAWIARLEERIADQAALAAAQPLVERAARDRARYERELALLRRSEPAASRPALAAEGQLLESFALRAGQARLRYRLQDPLTGEVRAYLELSAELERRAAELLGRYVGVQGQRRSDPARGADTIEVTQIEPLEREPAATRPARQSP